MNNSAADFEGEVMNESDPQVIEYQKQLQSVHQNLRTVRHAINNHVAVIMAMAELSQRNPAQSAKLSQLCLEKAPQIATAIGSFSELFEGLLSLQAQLDTRAQQTQ